MCVYVSSVPSLIALTSPELSPDSSSVGQFQETLLVRSLEAGFWTSALCHFFLTDIPALETVWSLSHFGISFWVCAFQGHGGGWGGGARTPVPWSPATPHLGPGWQACLLWLMMWLMDKIRKNIQKNISVWAGVSASLHQVAAEGIFCRTPHYTVMAFPGKAVSFHDTRQQAALWALGPPSPEEGEAH